MHGALDLAKLRKSAPAITDWSIASIWIFVALLTIAMAIAISYVGGINAPFLDAWAFTNPDTYMAEPFQRYNGHPVLTNRLALALDYWAFDGLGDSTRIEILLAKAGEVVAFVSLGRLGGLKSLQDTLLLTAAIAIAVFNPAPDVNFRQGFQFSFVLVFASTVGAIAALTAYAKNERPHYLILAILLGVVATQSLLTGVLAPLLMLMMAVRLTLSRTTIAILFALFVFAIAMILFTPGGRLSSPKALSIGMVIYTLQIIGGAPAHIVQMAQQALDLTPLPPPQTAAFFGALMMLGFAPLMWSVVTSKKGDPLPVALAAIILFAVGSALMIALGRYANGRATALSPRFAETSGIVLGSLIVAAALSLAHITAISRRATLIAGAVLVMIVPLAGSVAVARNAGVERARTLGLSAQIVQIRDGDATLGLGRDGVARRYFPTALATLRADHKMHFADRWSRSMGETPEITNTQLCGGQLTFRESEFDGFERFRGGVDSAAVTRGRSIIVVNDQGVIVGYGRALRRWDDFMGTLMKRPNQDAVGYAASHAADAHLSAYLANQSGIICKLRVRNLP